MTAGVPQLPLARCPWTCRSRTRARPALTSDSCSRASGPASTATRASRTGCPTCPACRDGSSDVGPHAPRGAAMERSGWARSAQSASRSRAADARPSIRAGSSLSPTAPPSCKIGHPCLPASKDTRPEVKEFAGEMAQLPRAGKSAPASLLAGARPDAPGGMRNSSTGSSSRTWSRSTT